MHPNFDLRLLNVDAFDFNNEQPIPIQPVEVKKGRYSIAPASSSSMYVGGPLCLSK